MLYEYLQIIPSPGTLTQLCVVLGKSLNKSWAPPLLDAI